MQTILEFMIDKGVVAGDRLVAGDKEWRVLASEPSRGIAFPEYPYYLECCAIGNYTARSGHIPHILLDQVCVKDLSLKTQTLSVHRFYYTSTNSVYSIEPDCCFPEHHYSLTLQFFRSPTEAKKFLAHTRPQYKISGVVAEPETKMKVTTSLSRTELDKIIGWNPNSTPIFLNDIIEKDKE